ncbi:MAG TPA: response regulator [Polyangiaceae bacterium]|nr:response regulator [Polyangiaceae bacterium]
MSSGTSDPRNEEGSRLGGARADFVASLGRKIQGARELLAQLEDDPTSRPARDELRRRMHALGAGARMLRFDAMARSIGDVLTVLERASMSGMLREQDVAFVAQVVDDLPALAWGESLPREPVTAAPPAGDESEPERDVAPVSALVVGAEELAEALTEDGASAARPFECERTSDVQSALQLARAFAPDVLVVDADLTGANELVEALLDDPLTEPVPIVVVGTFGSQDESARFVALGVAKALAKPVPPSLLRTACEEVLDSREGRTVRVTLGEPTLEQLADRLAEEIKRALTGSVDRPALSCRVPLGEGTEVLGALWGAIARVQEIVSQRTGGAVRFGGDAPEGAIALAPWLHQDLPGADRLAGRGRGAAADVRLQGRRVVVADDDPGVTWFISDLLRTAGCEVHEALDGLSALTTAYRVQPELVVSDILMPGMDGFALSRALHRDVALRDVPVILLSWKEDLLQRVRELGASAAAYMRKESDSRAVLARVREVLRPRARIEMRLRGDGEVRGRLDGVTARLLLELVGSIRRDARVAVRDASYLYEIEIRDGSPRKATRTASDGGYQSGERALASLLGVGAGRFVVSPSREAIRGELTGTLYEQLARPIAAARGALAAATGARTMNVERITIDEEALEEYLRATPEPARALIKRLAHGDSPRQMLLAGEVPPSLFEDVVSDLAARGAIRGVAGVGGTDVLTPAVDAALSVLRGAPKRTQTLPPNARPSVLPAMVAIPVRPPQAKAVQSAPATLPEAGRAARPPVPRPDSGKYESFKLSEPPPPPPAPASAPVIEEQPVPSSLEDAVMREISDRSPEPGMTHSTSNPPPIVEPSELRPRSSNPPAVVTPEEEEPLPSIPPDAIVPGASSGEEQAAAPVSASAPGLRAAPPVEPVHDTAVDAPVAQAKPAPPPPLDRTLPLPIPRPAPKPAPPPLPTPARQTAAKAPPAAAKAPAAAPAAPRRRIRWGVVLAFLLLGFAVGAVINATHPEEAAPGPSAVSIGASGSPIVEKPSASAALMPTAPASSSVAVPVSPSASASVSASASTAPGAPSASSSVGDDIPLGAEVPAGYGLVEVHAAPGSRLRIDGAVVANGPSASLVAAPGYHEVRAERDGRTTKHVVEVRAGKITRVDFLAP